MQIHTNGIMLCKKNLDILLNAIEQNNHAEIMKAVDGFYEEMRERGIAGEVMRLNINYLLFQLLHLITANLEQNKCNLYSFYKVKYLFIEIQKSF